ncbi:DNA-binding transcriptional regulator, MurR/RpiR family, contains HTH and SIS domains [Thalassobacillus cyri]|uniref:DNA-binding transcriptional regulator, MurR/RpiR family, contains HTH and SIS domains n=1 Tax=Thalassobacillus cyri TaxID=571932 RepID=A0A1H3VRD4_9BACI|nr:MurR/RpiR family transcriptional regulator [Thalassobacillus cyri]SDZ77337.1 DNA-binding transcriptional regulator, MurR/RpiR family, contains HTH and SIS domains [Thalassobacillus cyri]
MTQKLLEGNLLNVIRSYYPSLTKSEQKVADTVLDDINSVLYCSVTDLADKSGVGETTALRFCRKLGFKGYQEFKLTLAKTLSNDNKEEVVEEGVHHQIAKNTKAVIDETLEMVDEDLLNSCISVIHQAKQLRFYGVATSGLTALDAKNRLLRIGKASDAIIDPHIQSMDASTLGSGDVVVGISVSGSTKDTLDSLEIAKKNGATVIAITFYARSPITQVADYVLLSGGKESPLEGGSLAAKISQLFIIDLLCTGLALHDKEKALQMKEKTARSVINKIY